MWWIIGGIVVILLLLVVRARRNRLAHAKIVSLVLMLKEPRLVDAAASDLHLARRARMPLVPDIGTWYQVT